MVSDTPPENSSQQPDPAPTAVPDAAHSAPWSQNLELLRGLASIVAAEEISELEVEAAGVRITLKGPSAAVAANLTSNVALAQLHGLHGQLALNAASGLPPVGVAGAALASGSLQPVGDAGQAVPDENIVPIVSPMIGIFYRASSPDSPPLVEVGDYVEIGQEVGLVEAMKVFNEITSEVEGTVVEIRAQNAELVETGSPLILIRKP